MREHTHVRSYARTNQPMKQRTREGTKKRINEQNTASETTIERTKQRRNDGTKPARVRTARENKPPAPAQTKNQKKDATRHDTIRHRPPLTAHRGQYRYEYDAPPSAARTNSLPGRANPNKLPESIGGALCSIQPFLRSACCTAPPPPRKTQDTTETNERAEQRTNERRNDRSIERTLATNVRTNE